MILSASQARISYTADARLVLDDVSVRVLPGILTGVIGPNGSGKSTLVRSLSRVLRPQAGDVWITEADTPGRARSLYRETSAREAACAVAVVPQSASVQMEFTVREIVAMGRAPHTPARLFAPPSAYGNEKVAHAMATAGVEELAERTATQLSGGEWQRVLLARALAQETDILLLDEPTAHLDLRHQQEVLILMRRLAHEENKAVLGVLHDLNLAAAYCDYLLLLQDGRVVAEGSPDQVLTPSVLGDVYGTQVAVLPHPLTGRPTVMPMPSEEEIPAADALAVHVVCGAGTGAALFMRLRQMGVRVTAGALSTIDPDARAAALLKLEVVTEIPFASISIPAQQETRRLMRGASAVVVTETPFGSANIANLELVLEQARAGQPVFCIGTADFALRDVTPDGLAARLWAELLLAGAVVVSTTEALPKELAQSWKLCSPTV